jgi:hypothetical protein
MLASSLRWLAGSAIVLVPFVSSSPRPPPASPDIVTAPAADVAPRTVCDDAVASASRVLEEQRRLSEQRANEVFAAIERAAREASCVERLAAQLERAAEPCGHGTNLVTSALFASEGWPAERTTKVVRGPVAANGQCLRAILPNVQHAAHVDAALASAVHDLTRANGDEEARDAAWMTLGSLEHVAMREGRSELAARIDILLAEHLTHSSGAGVASAIEAAGNAGCTGCTARLAALARSRDGETRRAVAGAWRFVSSAASIGRMCTALRDDGEMLVREHAAWALGWDATAGVAARVSCLREAAARDRSAEVRAAAVHAVGRLAVTSGPAPSVVAALEAMKHEPFTEDVRAIAWATAAARDGAAEIVRSALPLE